MGLVQDCWSPVRPERRAAGIGQTADLCALLLQIYVVMGAGWVWYRGLQGEHVPSFVSAVVLFGAAGVVALASTVGVASGLRHGHHAPLAQTPTTMGRRTRMPTVITTALARSRRRTATPARNLSRWAATMLATQSQSFPGVDRACRRGACAGGSGAIYGSLA